MNPHDNSPEDRHEHQERVEHLRERTRHQQKVLSVRNTDDRCHNSSPLIGTTRPTRCCPKAITHAPPSQAPFSDRRCVLNYIIPGGGWLLGGLSHAHQCPRGRVEHLRALRVPHRRRERRHGPLEREEEDEQLHVREVQPHRRRVLAARRYGVQPAFAPRGHQPPPPAFLAAAVGRLLVLVYKRKLRRRVGGPAQTVPVPLARLKFTDGRGASAGRVEVFLGAFLGKADVEGNFGEEQSGRTIEGGRGGV